MKVVIGNVKLFSIILGYDECDLPPEFRITFCPVTVMDGSDMASGIYLYKLEAGEFVEAKRMMLLK